MCRQIPSTVVQMKNIFKRTHWSRPTLAVAIVIISLANPGAFAQETVDPRSGQLQLEVTDLVVAAGPLTLDITRTFHSGNALAGVLGPGWHLSWESSVHGSSPEAVVFDGGRAMVFRSEDGGEMLHGPSGERLSFEDGQNVIRSGSGDVTSVYEVHDGVGRLAKLTYPNGNTIQLSYSESGTLERIEGPKGSFLDLMADERGRVTRVASSLGTSVDYGYVGAHLTEVRVNGGPPENYVYDESALLVAIDRSATGRVDLTYDAWGRVTRRQWADGGEELFEYSNLGRFVRQTHPTNGITTYSWSEDGLRHEITDPLGHTTITDYDLGFRPVAITDSAGATTRYGYDTLGRVDQIVLPGDHIIRFEYRGDSHLVTTMERHGGTREKFAYDDAANLLTHTIGGEVFRSYTYTPSGLLERISGIGRSEVVYGYHPNGQLHTETHTLGRITTYEYDQRGNLVALAEPGDRVTRWSFDEQNRITSETDPAGQATRYEYDPSGRLTTVEGPLGAVTRYTYDAVGRVATETDSLGNTSMFSYRPDDQQESATDPEGNRTRWSYDLKGRLIGIADSLGSLVAFDYDELDRVVTATGAGGELWNYTWESDGTATGVDAPGYVSVFDPATGVEQLLEGAGEHLTIERDPLGRVISTRGTSGSHLLFRYDSAGNLEAIQDDQGLETTFGYDAAGRRTRTANPTGLQIRYRYDAADRVLGITDNLGGSLAIDYDSCDRMLTVTGADGSKTRFSYDANGRLTERIDPLGNTMEYTYDAAGRLREISGGSDNRVRFEYDAAGRLTVIRHPDGGSTSYSRDARGNAVREVDPLGNATTRRFDDGGRLVEETDAAGGVTTLSYDKRGLLVQVKRPDGVSVRYQYDANDRPTEVDDGAFPVHFDYDPEGNVTRVSYPALDREIRYSYDDAGRRTLMIDPQGRSYTYQYDRFGRFDAVVLEGGTRIDLSYDAKDRLDSITYPNGVVEQYTYDTAGRTAAVAYRDASGTILSGQSSTFDSSGNRISVEHDDGTVTRYRYDAAGQLLETIAATGSTRFEYLPVGRRASVAHDDSTTNFVYDRAGRLLRAGEEIFQYDARGNITERAGPTGTTRYRWDAADHLIGASLPDGRSVNFGYAPTGERIWREDGEGRMWYLNDGENLIATLDDELNLQSSFLHGPELDQPLLMTSAAGTLHTYMRDALGSITGLVDTNGSVVVRYRTNAFGTPESPAARPPNPFLFTGRVWDADLGLYDFRHRIYDPKLGRFLSPDPLQAAISTPLDLERYAYAYNAPTRYTDPLGLRIRLDVMDKMILLEGGGNPIDTNALQGVRRLSRTYGGSQREIARLVVNNYQHQQNLWSLRDSGPRPQYLSVSKPSLKQAIESVEHQLDLNRLFHRPGVNRRSPSSRLEGARRFLQQQQQREYARVLRQLENQGIRMRGQYGPSPPPTGGRPAVGSQGPGGTRIGAAPSGSFTGSSGGGSPATGSPPSGVSNTPPSEGANPAVSRGENAIVPAPGSSAAVAGAPGTAPVPRWNPNHRPQPLSTTRGPWTPIKPKVPTALERFTKPPTAGQTGMLTILLTAEMIARCRTRGLTAGECAEEAIPGFLILAGTAIVCIKAPAIGVVVVVAGTALAIHKGVTDVIEGAYEGMDYWNAVENRDRILEDRKKWTEENIKNEEKKKRLLLLERKIRDTADQLREACAQLASIADVMTRGAKSVEAELANKPSAGTINAGADACRTLPDKGARLRAIQGDIDALIEITKGEVDTARSLAEACRTKQDAVKLKALIQANDATLQKIEKTAAEAKKIQGELDRDRVKINKAQNDLRKAMTLRDLLIDAANSIPPIAATEAEVRRAEAAIDLLTDPSPSLGNDIKNLIKAFGDYDTLSLEMIADINELRQLVRDSQSLVAQCKPADFLTRHRDAANRVVTAKLNAQALIDQVDAAPLADCNVDSLRSLAQAIQKSTEGTAGLRSVNDEAKNKAQGCLAEHGLSVTDSGGGAGSGSSSGSSGEPPPLVEASSGGSGGGGGGGGKPPLVDASKTGGPTTGGEPGKSSGVGGSTTGRAEAGDGELVYANLDIELAQDDYGIYDILDNLRDSEIIIKTPQGDKQYLGADAVKYLAEKGWIIHKGGVGWIATDRLKRFLGIGEPDEPEKKKDSGRSTLGGMTFDAPLENYNPDDPNTPEGKRKILGELSRQCQTSAAWGRFWTCIWDDCGTVFVDRGIEVSNRCHDACSDEFEKNKPPVCHEADALAAQLENMQ